jgi:KAP family P-loop domain
MSTETIKNNIEQLILDDNNSVIALSGKWGTGKTYLWKESIKKTNQNELIKNSLYISLFGVKDVEELKIKILLSLHKDNKLNDYLKDSQGILEKLFGNKLTAIKNLALFAIPSVMKDQLIVIDDIERKYKKFELEEIMGFIDGCIQNYGSRFLLILNIDQLDDDKNEWEKFREKIIDHELKLETSPAEAFDIANRKANAKYPQEIKQSVEICNVNNIRIIKKAINSVKNIIGHRTDLTKEVINRVIPSTVLLSNIYFKGIEGGPSIEFVLEFNSVVSLMKREPEKNNPDKEYTKKQDQWSSLLRKLEINGCDEYEDLIVQYLQTGIINKNKIDQVLNRYVDEKDINFANIQKDNFVNLHFWHPELSESDLLKEAKNLLKYTHLFDAYTITSLNETVQEYKNGKQIADQFITTWLNHYKKRDHCDFHYELDVFGRKLHPDIEKAFQELNLKYNPPISLFEVASNVFHNRSWGDKERKAMKESTPDLFLKTISSLNGDDLRIFFIQNIDWQLQKDSYVNQFGSGMDNFVEACKTIYKKDKNSRLSKIIINIFRSKNLDNLLSIQNDS